MKKIAFITPYFYPVIGGTQTVVVNLAKQLINKGHDVEIITPKIDKNSKENDIYDGISVKRHSWMVSNTLLNEFIFHLQMTSYLKKFDIIQVFHPYFSLSGYLAKKIFRKKLYINLIGWDTYNPVDKSKIINKLVKFFGNRANLIFSSGNFLMRKTREQGVENKIVVIPHGINIDNNKKIEVNIRKKYGIGNKRLYAFIGRLTPVKDPLFMLKVWKEVKQKNVFLIIVGDGELNSKMKKYIKENNIKNIKMTGFVPKNELTSIYKSADILIHYSLYESFGLTILEGMSYGLPVISTNTGAIPEIVTKNVGILVNLKDEYQLKKAIDNIPKKVNALKKNSIKQAKAYQWNKIIDKYIKYY